MKYKNDYAEFIQVLDRILGFDTDAEIHALTELFKNEKKNRA